MPRLYIYEFETRKEPANDRYCLVWDIEASRSPYKQCRFVESMFIGICKRKVSHVIESICKNVNRDAKSQRLGRRVADNVSEEKAAH